MCSEHHADGTSRPFVTGATSSRATRRRFLTGGAGVLAGALALPLFGTTAAGAEEAPAESSPSASTDRDSPADASSGDRSSEAAAETASETGDTDDRDAVTASGLIVPTYRNRSSWGADESLRLDDNGQPAYPLAFFPVQKIIVHHTASWTPWNDGDAAGLVRAVYEEHIGLEFGDIGYHLLIDQQGTVYEGRYSGGTRFPVYDVLPADSSGGPLAVNAAHTYRYNAGSVGIALLGDYDETDISDEAWSALTMTVAMICANTGLDPVGQSRYLNPINGTEKDMPNIIGHRRVVGTACPGESVAARFPELRETAAALVDQLDPATWLA